MATARQCRSALTRLAVLLDALDAQTKARYLPDRSVACRIKDLDVVFTARLDETGLHDIAQLPKAAAEPPQADVRVSVDSDDLIALAAGEDEFISAWLHGRLQISAPMRDMLRLRSVLGL
jgi:predicted lipid carrier protein YhbT